MRYGLAEITRRALDAARRGDLHELKRVLAERETALQQIPSEDWAVAYQNGQVLAEELAVLTQRLRIEPENGSSLRLTSSQIDIAG